MFRRTCKLGTLLVCLSLFTLAPAAQAGVIQDLAALKVDISYLQGRFDQFEADHGAQLTPAQQQKLDKMQELLQDVQNKAEELMGSL